MQDGAEKHNRSPGWYMKQIEMPPGSLQIPCPSPGTSKPAAKAQTRAEVPHPVLPCILQMPEPGWGKTYVPVRAAPVLWRAS